MGKIKGNLFARIAMKKSNVKGAIELLRRQRYLDVAEYLENNHPELQE
jgi:hypothetical protein